MSIKKKDKKCLSQQSSACMETEKNGGRRLLVFSVLNVGGVAAQEQLTKPTVTSASPTIQR